MLNNGLKRVKRKVAYMQGRWLYADKHFEDPMAGHSQYKNIMFRKGKQDKMRSKIFSKLAREITVAAKAGVPDPAANARLRLAIQNARAENLPKDNIERAIKKASGSDAENYEMSVTKVMALVAWR